MSKKKKKKEPRSEAPAVETATERDEQAESNVADVAATEGSHGDAVAHGAEADGHGHGGHDPVEEDRPRNGLIAFITLITCITLVVFVVFVRELFNSWGNAEIQEKVLGRKSQELIALRAAEKQKLTKYRWVSQKDGVVGIPTDRAIELTIASYRNPPPPVQVPTLVAPEPKPEEAKPADKPDEKKGDEGKDDKGAKDKKKGDAKEGGK